MTAGVTETSIYVAGLLERVTKGGVTDFRHLISGTPGTVALHTRRSSGTSDTYYLHRDHLGSAELITNAAGAQVVKLSFSAYGERRDTDWDGPASSAHLTTLGNTTRHGYTDHEHLDSVGLIHMGGRVYDPRIGRFLSRDPYIDGVDSSQGANGYAYVHNNPLSRWDPTGYTNQGLEEIVVTGSRLRFSWSAADWHHFVARFPYRNEGGGRGAGGDGGDGDGAKEPGKEEPEGEQPRSELCLAGNSLARAADFLGDNAARAQAVGLAALAITPVFPHAWTPALALLAGGGAVGSFAAGLQLSAGIAQSAGGGDGSANVGYAALVIVTGYGATRGIIGPTVSGYRTVSQRAGDALSRGAATTVGGVNSLTQTLVDQAAPRQVECP